MEGQEFAEWSRAAQVRALRAVAREALRAFGMPDAALTLVDYAFNITFRVDTTIGERFALRINVNSERGPTEVRAEADWVTAIGEETDLLVPEPRKTLAGERVWSTRFEPLGRELPVVLYRWLGGRHLDDRTSDLRVAAIGAAMAKLHAHAEQWQSSSGHTYVPVGSVLMDMDDHLRELDQPWYDDASRTFIESVRAHLEKVTAPVFARGPQLLIHGDLHYGNLKWVDGQLGVIDFDDAGIGSPVQDLAIAAYYLRDLPGKESALLAGYSSVRAVPSYTSEEFEGLVAARNFQLLNLVVDSATGGYDEFAPGYMDRTSTRFRNYLDTGHFEL